MYIKSILTLSSLAILATANPGWGTSKTSSKWGPTPTTSAPAKPTGGFLNQCENFGISLLDCTQLANIAALNGNSIGVGSSAPSAPVNNGEQFLNACKNFGISVGDCAQLLNIAILNGNNIDIDLTDLTSLLGSLGLSTGVLGGLLPSLTGGLIPLVTGIV